jgi:hypothetical protein
MWFVIYISHKERALPKTQGPQQGKTSRRGSKPARTASSSKPSPPRAEFFALPVVGGGMPTRRLADTPIRCFASSPFHPRRDRSSCYHLPFQANA